MQSKMGFPSSHQLKSNVVPKSRLEFARTVLSPHACLLIVTATDTMTDLVNNNCEGSILLDVLRFLPGSCLVHTVDRFHSKGWFSCEHDISNVFSVFLVKSMQH